MNWSEAQRVHSEAAMQLAATAESVRAEGWLVPIVEAKWSPAEIVEHLNLGYDVLTRELEGGPGMQIRTKAWQRILLRFWLVPKLLRGAPFPANSRAPREMRPQSANPDREAAVRSFREKASRFESLAAQMQRDGRRVRLTHPYFGRAAVSESVMMCARHVQHHQRQLANG